MCFLVNRNCLVLYYLHGGTALREAAGSLHTRVVPLGAILTPYRQQ